MNRASLVLVFLALSGSLSLAHAEDAASPRLPTPIFYFSFDQGDLAYLKGALAHRFPLDRQYLHEGKFGRGYRFEPPYANLLPPGQADPVEAQFTTGPGAALKFTAGPPRVLEATGHAGVLWQTQPLELSKVPAPNNSVTKSFLASVYLRSKTTDTVVRLEVLDAVDSTDWKQPILEANAAALKKDPAAKVREPLETKLTTKDVTLTPAWQRVTAELAVDSRRPVQQLALSLVLVSPTGQVEASRLQLEQSQWYPHYKRYASPWIPGGEQRASNALRMLLRDFEFSGREGTLSTWVRFPAPEGGGTREGHFLTAGGGWWRPVWMLGTYSTYAGDVGKANYQAGKGTFHHQFRATGDGQWHHVALTWFGDTCFVYCDGKETGRGTYLSAEPSESAPFLIGATTLEGSTSSAFVDEVAVWDAALSPEELQALATATAPLGADLPTLLVERPQRLLFHRGEKTAPVRLALASAIPRTQPLRATLSIPAMGVSEPIVFPPGQPATVQLRPWLVTPGKYPLRVDAPAEGLHVTANLEVVASLPPTDFSLLGWSNDAALKELGFTAELGSDPEPSLRRGMLLTYRFDARSWHPLDPAIKPASLAAAEADARTLGSYPHIVATLLNTEVGIGTPPSAPWFLKWMKDSLGLETVPPEVHYGPLLITGPPDQPALIPERDPVYRFARWFTREGKGWPALNAQVADLFRAAGLKTTLHYTDQPTTTADFTGLDMADFWHYPHVPSGLVPEFNRVCNLARLAGKKIQLTPGTIFWDPWPMHVDNKIVLLSPDLLRQFLWLALASPGDYVGLYGWGELRDGFMLPGTKETLKETAGAIYPVGMLTGGLRSSQLPVAYLETEGQYWMGPGDNQWIQWWFNRMTTRALAEARLRYDWIGDDHVAAGWLRNYGAVVMLGAWRVPEPVHRELVRYAQAGGTVVVDKRCRAEIPGATVLDIADRAQKPETVAALQTWAREYQQAHPQPLRLASTDEAWLFDKLDGPARFIFVVNDKRKPGDLGTTHKLTNNFGTHSGPVEDAGEEQTVSLTLPANGGRALYDVRAHQELPLAAGQPVLLRLGPTDTAVLALLPQRLTALSVQAPPTVKAGSESVITLTVRAEGGAPVSHRDVVEIHATDAAGNPLDLPRYLRVTGGKVEIPLRLPRGCPPGKIALDCREWIAGLQAAVSITVTSG